MFESCGCGLADWKVEKEHGTNCSVAGLCQFEICLSFVWRPAWDGDEEVNTDIGHWLDWFVVWS